MPDTRGRWPHLCYIEKALDHIRKTNPPQSVLLILFWISAKERCGEIELESHLGSYHLDNLSNFASTQSEISAETRRCLSAGDRIPVHAPASECFDRVLARYPRHLRLWCFCLPQQTNILNIFILIRMASTESLPSLQKKRRNPNRCRPKSRGGCQRCKQRRVSRGERCTVSPSSTKALLKVHIANTYSAQMWWSKAKLSGMH